MVALEPGATDAAAKNCQAKLIVGRRCLAPSSLVPCAQLPPAPDAVLQPLALPSFPLTLSLPLSLIDRDWVRRTESRSDAMAKARLTDGTRHLPFHVMTTNGTGARH